MTNPFEPIKGWHFRLFDEISSEVWSIAGKDDYAYVEETRKNGQEDTHVGGSVYLIDGIWTMEKNAVDCIKTYRDEGTAAAIVAYLNEHGVPWNLRVGGR